MLNKERIENNPYRILGVYVGSPISVEVNHLNRIRAFSKVGQPATFQMRGDDVLSPAVRTKESAEAAAQTLSLARDRVENAIIWFSDGDHDWGRVLNAAVEALLENDYTKAINYYELLISDRSIREDFLASVSHGLLTLTREDLANIISEIISLCEDDMEGFWMSDCKKTSGLIASCLFEKTISGKLEALIQSIEFYNILGNLSTDKEVHGIDFYDFIDRFVNTLNEIRPILQTVGDVYGVESIEYKSFTEELCKKTYTRGAYLIHQIGEFVWIQNPKNRLPDNSYKKYRSKMPIGCIRACMDLIYSVDTIVNETINWAKIDAVSEKILYSDIDSYQTAKRIEFVSSDDIIRRSVRSFQIKRGISIAAWLAFLYLVFF